MNCVMVIDAVNGQGHVSRSTALREAMPPEWRISTCKGIDDIGSEDDLGALRSTADLIIVDDYRVDADLIAHWQDRCPVVVFDDGQFTRAPDAAVVVLAFGGMSSEIVEVGGRVLLAGHDYCPIRQLGEVPVVDGLVVSLPGTILASVVDMIAAMDSIAMKSMTVVDVVRSTWPSRPRLLLCAGGQTCLEAAHLGVPSVIVTVADNQNANARGLQDAGLARWFGTWAEAAANPGALAECVREHLANEEWRRHVAEGPKWIDGKGGARIVEHMRRLVR